MLCLALECIFVKPMNYDNNINNDSLNYHLYSGYGVEPYEGNYIEVYEYREFVGDVVVYSKNYLSSIEHFDGELNAKLLVPNWLTVIVVLLIGLIAYVRSYHNKRFSILIKGLVNRKVSQQVIRYEKVYFHPVNVLLSIVFLISTCIFFTLAYQHTYSPKVNVLYLSSIIFVGIIVIAIVKIVLYNFSSWLLSISDIMQDYVFQSSLFNKLYGIINSGLIILLLFSPFNTQLIILSSIAILFVFMLMQLIRGLLIGIQNAIPLHLIILYLCTLEILPWLIIGKWIGNLL